MKKKIIFVFIAFLSMFLVIGCSNEVIDNNPNDEENEVEEKRYQSKEWNCDVQLSDIKTIKYADMMSIQPNLFISKDGDLYQFTLNKKYSNEQNCKKYEYNYKFKGFYIYPNDRDLSVIVTDDGTFKYLDNDNNNLVNFYSQLYRDKDKYISKIYNDTPFSYSVYVGGYDDYYDVYNAKNNKLYVKRITTQGKYVSEKEIGVFPEDETVLSLEGQVFITNKAFYKVGATNEEQCDAYEDIECIEGLIKIEDISKEYDDIEYFNGNFIIYKNDPKIYLYYYYF